MKFKFIDLLLYALLFVFVAAFPVDRFQIPEIYRATIQIGLRVLLIGFYIFIIIKNKIKIFGMTSISALLFCVPFVIACFSNMIATSIEGTVSGVNMSGEMLAVSIVLSFTIAITEELLFRLFIQNSLTKVGSFQRIIGSAGIFAVMHLINLANVSSVDALVTVLIQVVYDFGLGLLLGFMYEFSHSIVACILFHFGFNLCNQVLFQYYGFNPSTLSFYLTAIVIAVILIGYTIAIYYFRFRKLDRYFRS